MRSNFGMLAHRKLKEDNVLDCSLTMTYYALPLECFDVYKNDGRKSQVRKNTGGKFE